jgi:MFS family permease
LTAHTLTRRSELVAVIGTICAFSFTVGLIYPVIALALEARGFDEGAIGLNATASGAGVFAAGLLVPRFVRRYGTFAVLAASTIGGAVTLLLFPVFDAFESWLVLRFLLGMCVTALFAMGEAWINSIATDETRGRTMAIYVSFMASSFAFGSLAVKAVGFEGYLPFVLGAAMLAVLFAPVLPFHNRDPLADAEDLSENRGLMMRVLKQAAVLMAVVALFGTLDGVALGLLPSYALAVGVAPSEASVPLAAMAFGVVLFQFPLGYLSDRIPRPRLLSIVLFAVVVLAVFVPLIDLTHWTGILYMMLFGGLSFSPYTLALSILGERYRGRALAAGSALFALMWGIGSTAGPLGFGPAMELMGPLTLPLGLALLFLITAAVSLLDRGGPSRRA